MKPFEAFARDVPKPHTWGEVALVQARLLSDSWQPDKLVWVKIMSDKELLGEGKLCQGWIVGEDKSDVPQCSGKRLVHEITRTSDSEGALFPNNAYAAEYLRQIAVDRLAPGYSKWISETHERAWLQEKHTIWHYIENLYQKGLHKHRRRM